MKARVKWLMRVLWLTALTTILTGCATFLASDYDYDKGKKEFYNNPILTDEILAIGRPDAALLKKMELDNTIAFIGKKNTYMLYLGGEELEQISKLKLVSKRLSIGSDHKLYLKDKQVWGEIALNYWTDKEVSAEEKTELEKGGFTPYKDSDKRQNFTTTIRIEGVVYPAIKIADEQISKLKVKRQFNLYNPRESAPLVTRKILEVPVIATGVVVDILLIPVYLGLGVFVLVVAGVSGVAH